MQDDRLRDRLSLVDRECNVAAGSFAVARITPTPYPVESKLEVEPMLFVSYTRADRNAMQLLF